VQDGPSDTRSRFVKGDRSLELDELAGRLERFAALRDTDSAAADAVLDELGATSDVDRDIVVQLSGRAPLAYPERFFEAHALAMRALEVLDRNGARRVRVKTPQGPSPSWRPPRGRSCGERRWPGGGSASPWNGL
jgi:hypothetical protein